VRDVHPLLRKASVYWSSFSEVSHTATSSSISLVRQERRTEQDADDFQERWKWTPMEVCTVSKCYCNNMAGLLERLPSSWV
jgi:hypothetical protein